MLQQFGLLHRIIELHQEFTGFNLLPRVEVQRRHPAGCLGSDGDLGRGFQFANGVELLWQADLLHAGQ
ncbi:hypothetical protein TUM17383_15290 [Shewanella algae]|nr:hypothetical protein TUM17383_15290 [Shewanella algae]